MRTISSAISAVMIAALLLGCSSQDPTAAKSTTAMPVDISIAGKAAQAGDSVSQILAQGSKVSVIFSGSSAQMQLLADSAGNPVLVIVTGDTSTYFKKTSSDASLAKKVASIGDSLNGSWTAYLQEIGSAWYGLTADPKNAVVLDVVSDSAGIKLSVQVVGNPVSQTVSAPSTLVPLSSSSSIATPSSCSSSISSIAVSSSSLISIQSSSSGASMVSSSVLGLSSFVAVSSSSLITPLSSSVVAPTSSSSLVPVASSSSHAVSSSSVSSALLSSSLVVVSSSIAPSSSTAIVSSSSSVTLASSSSSSWTNKASLWSPSSPNHQVQVPGLLQGTCTQCGWLATTTDGNGSTVTPFEFVDSNYTPTGLPLTFSLVSGSSINTSLAELMFRYIDMSAAGADISSYGGYCLTYTSDAPIIMQLGWTPLDYNVFYLTLPAQKTSGTVKLPWSSFHRDTWATSSANTIDTATKEAMGLYFEVKDSSAAEVVHFELNKLGWLADCQ